MLNVPRWTILVVLAVLALLGAPVLCTVALLVIVPPLAAHRYSTRCSRRRNMTLAVALSATVVGFITLLASLPAHAAPLNGEAARLVDSLGNMVLALCALVLVPVAVAILMNVGHWLGRHPRFVLVCVAVALAALGFSANLALAQSRASLDIPRSCPDPRLCRSAGLTLHKRTQTSTDKNRTAAGTTNPGLAAQLLTTTRRARPEWTPCWRMEQLVRAGLTGREHTWTDGSQRVGRRLVHTVWLQYYCKSARSAGLPKGAQSYIEVTLVRGRVTTIQRQWH